MKRPSDRPELNFQFLIFRGLAVCVDATTRRDEADCHAERRERTMTACGDDTRCGRGDAPMTRERVLLGVTTLDGVERSVAYARRFVRDVLGPAHPAQDDVALCVSELATNAIKHTPNADGGKITIGLSLLDRVIRAEVT